MKGRSVRVLIAHAEGEEARAAELAAPLEQAGYEVVHRGTLLVGDSLVEEASKVLAEGGPLVVCGTIRAVGTRWARRLVNAARGHGDALVLPVRMEQDADLEMLDWGQVRVAEHWQDPARAVAELCAALARRYPAGEAEPVAVETAQGADERYRELLLANYDLYDWSGLPVRDPQLTTSKLELRRLYVPLRVVVESSADTGLDPARLAALERERREERGVWSFQRARETLQQRDEQARVSIGERLAASRRLVVLGDPGTGKSTLLKWIATAYLLRLKQDPDWQDLPDVKTLPAGEWLPIMVRCRELDHDEPMRTLEEALDRTLGKLAIDRAGCGAMLPLLIDRLQAGRALLLIDGLDEINDPQTRSAFCEQVERVHVAYPDAPIIVTSRIVGYREMQRRIGRGFEHVKVAELAQADKEELARRWCHVTEAPARAEEAAADLIRDIRSADRVERLTGNPLLLTTMALVRRSLGRLPNRRGELYREAVQVLLNWRPDVGELLASDEVLPQLEYVAHAMCQRKVQQLRLDEIVDLCVAMRAEFPNIHAAGRHSPDRFVHLVEQRTGLLSETGYERHAGQEVPVYEFRHLTFQEYLAGLALVSGHCPGHVAHQTVAAAIEPLAAPVPSTRRADEEAGLVVPENWLEPVRLCAVTCRSSDVDAVLSAVLTPCAGEDAALTARPRAAFAALCLADEPDASTVVASRVIESLIGQVGVVDEEQDGRTDVGDAVRELCTSRWRDQLLESLLRAFRQRSPLDRPALATLAARVLAMASTPDQPADLRAEEAARVLDGDDEALALQAALVIGGTANDHELACAYWHADVARWLIRRCTSSSQDADAAAWALSQVGWRYRPLSHLRTSLSMWNTVWHLTGAHVALIGDLFQASAPGDGVIFNLYGIARQHSLAGIVPHARLGLQHPNGRMRAAAAYVLGDLGDVHSQAALTECLARDLDPRARAAAARSLGWLGADNALPRLIAALGDKDAEVRVAVWEAVGELGDRRCVGTLMEVLSDPDPRVRRTVVSSIASLDKPSALIAASILVGDTDLSVRRSVADYLRYLDEPGPEPILLSLLDDEDHLVRRSAIRAIGGLGPRPGQASTTQRIREHLTDSSSEVREQALETLLAICDDEMIAPCRDRLKDDRSVRTAALTAMARFGVPVSYDAVADQICGDDLASAGSAIEVLIGVGVTNLVDRLATACQRSPSWALPLATVGLHWQFGPRGLANVRQPALIEVFAQQIGHTDAEIRTAASLALLLLGDERGALVLDHMRTSCDRHLFDLCLAIRSIGQDQIAAVIDELARADAPSVREAIARRLGEIDYQGAFSVLSTLTVDHNPIVRSSATWSLWHLEPSDAVARLLVDRLGDVIREVGTVAAHALIRCKQDWVTHALLARCQDPRRRIRAAAVGSLGGRPADQVMPVLLESLRSEDPFLRNAAADALCATEQKPAIMDKLAALVGSPEPERRRLAITALPLGVHTQLIAGRLDDEGEGVRWAALRKLWPQRHPDAGERLRAHLASAKVLERKRALRMLAENCDPIDRCLLSGNLTGNYPDHDPRRPVLLGELRINAYRLELPVEEVQRRYEALADTFGLRLAWRQ